MGMVAKAWHENQSGHDIIWAGMPDSPPDDQGDGEDHSCNVTEEEFAESAADYLSQP